MNTKINPKHASELIGLLIRAHESAARNNKGNLSSVVATTAYIGSLNYLQGISAGILSLGGVHAPIEKCRKLLKKLQTMSPMGFELHILGYIQNKKKVPGFGHSFYKEGIDPAFAAAYNRYLDLVQAYGSRNLIGEMNRHLEDAFQRCEKKFKIHPNAALITAAISEFLDLDPGSEMVIALRGRITAWVDEMNKAKKVYDTKG